MSQYSLAFSDPFSIMCNVISLGFANVRLIVVIVEVGAALCAFASNELLSEDIEVVSKKLSPNFA
jgi:hypothetical protein